MHCIYSGWVENERNNNEIEEKKLEGKNEISAPLGRLTKCTKNRSGCRKPSMTCSHIVWTHHLVDHFRQWFCCKWILTLTEIDSMTWEFLALLPPLPITKIKCMQSHVTEIELIQFPNEMTLDYHWSSHSFDCIRLHTKRSLHCRYNYALSHNYYASERGRWPRKNIFGHWGACKQSQGTKTKQ